jgi:hypothetical protein
MVSNYIESELFLHKPVVFIIPRSLISEILQNNYADS